MERSDFTFKPRPNRSVKYWPLEALVDRGAVPLVARSVAGRWPVSLATSALRDIRRERTAAVHSAHFLAGQKFISACPHFGACYGGDALRV